MFIFIQFQCFSISGPSSLESIDLPYVPLIYFVFSFKFFQFRKKNKTFTLFFNFLISQF
jgi:hypothetical protein